MACGIIWVYMEPNAIVAYLRRVPLFQDLRPDLDARDEQLLNLIAVAVDEAHAAPGEWLFIQGDPADRLVIVTQGQVRLTAFAPDGSHKDFGYKGPGESFGETSLFIADFHDASAEAATEVHVLVLMRDDFLLLLEKHPRLRRRLNISQDLQRQHQFPRFPWMREDEILVHLGQRHPIDLVRRALLPGLAFLGVLVLLYLLSHAGWSWKGLLFPLIPGVLLGGLLIWDFIDWYDDRFALTTQRVLHVERKGPFGSMIEEASLADIQDVLEVRPNVLANLLDYGDIIIQTAGDSAKIDFTEVGKPALWRESIMREMGRMQARRVVRMRGEVYTMLDNRLKRVPPAEEAVRVEVKPETPKPVRILLGTIKELLFPSSWVVSSDQQTITWRRFWLPGFIRYWWVSLLFLIPTVGGVFWAASVLDERPLWVVGWLGLEMLLLVVVIWYIEDWRNDFFQLTPTHIIHVDRKPLWGRLTRQEARLDRIQNIASDIPDIFARVFKYGKVTLETAGTEGKFEIAFVRNPEAVRAEISRRQQEFRQRDLTRQAAQRQEELLHWFTIYDSLRQPAPNLAPPGEGAEPEGGGGI